jgi:hypothetical protein
VCNPSVTAERHVSCVPDAENKKDAPLAFEGTGGVPFTTHSAHSGDSGSAKTTIAGSLILMQKK